MQFSKNSLLRLVFVAVFAVAALCFLFFRSPAETKTFASASGPTPGVTNAPGENSCVVCHGDFPVNSGKGGRVTISGIPKNYLPNQAISVTVKVEQPQAVIYGFQMTSVDAIGAFRGSFLVPPANPQPLQVVSGMAQNQLRSYIEHTQNGTVPQQFGSRTWTFTFNTPPIRAGKLRFFAAGNAADNDQGTSGDYIHTTSAAMLSGSAIANFDNDVKSDLSVFRQSNGTWYSLSSETQQQVERAFGAAGDVITPGDFDGDGITDRAYWRPSTSTWSFEYSSGGGSALQILPGGIVPVAADYDGDLKTDVAYWRASTGMWVIRRSSDSTQVTTFLGHSLDRPVPADYDGDAKADVAVYRPLGLTWLISPSTGGSLKAVKFGARGDEPVPGDYDGDGRWDLAVFKPATSVWNILFASEARTGTQFGTAGGSPAPADYDGDGKTDLAVYNSGTWEILQSESGTPTSVAFGSAGDTPVARGQ